MKRTNGTDHTIVKKDTLEEKFKHALDAVTKSHDDGYDYENSSIPDYDDEIYDD